MARANSIAVAGPLEVMIFPQEEETTGEDREDGVAPKDVRTDWNKGEG